MMNVELNAGALEFLGDRDDNLRAWDAEDMTSPGGIALTGGLLLAFWIHEILRPISAGVSAYHGYKRHGDSGGAAVGWGVLGLFFPVITPTVALFQGYGKRK